MQPRPISLMNQSSMNTHDSLFTFGKPIFNRLPLCFRNHLIQLVGIIQNQHIITGKLCRAQVFPMFGNIRFDAVFISQKNQPSIDLWNFRMSIESCIGINKNLELRILRRQRGLFLAQYKSANQHHRCNHHQNSFSTLCHLLP